MNEKIIHLNDDSFKKDVLQSEGVFLVDFWASWCNPCKVISPILQEIANEFDKKLTVAKLNIDENPITAPQYGIRSVPTLLLFRDGKLVATKVGVFSKKQLSEFLNANL